MSRGLCGLLDSLREGCTIERSEGSSIVKRNLAATVLFGLVLVLAVACPGGESEESNLPVLNSPVIDPAIITELETASEVRVFVALRGLDVPIEEQPLDVVREHTAQVQARVLAILEPGDFDILHQFTISPALSGTATAAGVEKLSTHPDVVGIDLLGGGELH